MVPYLFLGFAGLLIATALMVVLHKNPVTSALFLVLAFVSLAGIYLLLQAEFLGMVQILVYAGAIMVLFLFVIMLLNLGRGGSDLRRIPAWLGVAILAGVLASQLGPLFGYSAERLALEYTGSTSLADPAIVFDSTQTAAVATVARGIPGDIAQPLFERYLVPFELTSVLLLTAIVGAVVLAKRKI